MCKLINLVAGVSDNTPILLNTEFVEHMRRQRRFRVENCWFQEGEGEGEGDFHQRGWENSRCRDVMSRLSQCSVSMEDWGEEEGRKFRKHIDYCKDIYACYCSCAVIPIEREAAEIITKR